MIVKLRVILGNLRFKLSAAQQPCACAASPVTRDARNILPLTSSAETAAAAGGRAVRTDGLLPSRVVTKKYFNFMLHQQVAAGGHVTVAGKQPLLHAGCTLLPPPRTAKDTARRRLSNSNICLQFIVGCAHCRWPGHMDRAVKT